MLYLNQLESVIHIMISLLEQLTELNNLDYCLRNCTKEESEQNNLIFIFISIFELYNNLYKFIYLFII
jgi:hypothetical protein